MLIPFEVAETKLPLFGPRVVAVIFKMAVGRWQDHRYFVSYSFLSQYEHLCLVRWSPSRLGQGSCPNLESLLELFPPWLLAAPKKKTSHSRKRMRSANKGLQDKESESEKCERLVCAGVNAFCICRYYCVPGMWSTAAYA
jgi:ribosomal protein L32